MRKSLIFVATALLASAAYGQDQDYNQPPVWGSDEHIALEDADWQRVVQSCQTWVQNRETSQINPADQQISCQLSKVGREQVGIKEVPKTYVTDSSLVAGASNGKGTQRSEQSQQRSETNTAYVMCPIVQDVKRVYRTDLTLSCEEVAAGYYQSKVQICQERWLDQLPESPLERKEALAPYQVNEVCISEAMVDCSYK